MRGMVLFWIGNFREATPCGDIFHSGWLGQPEPLCMAHDLQSQSQRIQIWPKNYRDLAGDFGLLSVHFFPQLLIDKKVSRAPRSEDVRA